MGLVKLGIVLKLFLGISCLIFYCEYLVFYFVQINCQWPTLDHTKQDKTLINISSSSTTPSKIMVLADTHLLGSRKGHWFDKLRREWQMYRAFQTAIQIHQPELVFILGDLFDEGLFCSDKEFDYYLNRFGNLFHVPENIELFVVVGNHDIGFHYETRPHLIRRFEKGFNTTSIQLISRKGTHFLLINSMALQGDGCGFCRTAENQLIEVEKTLKCSQKCTDKHCPSDCLHTNKLDQYSRPIILQHYPLYRKSDSECTDFDAAPSPVKEESFRETWECLSKEATYSLLLQIKPRLVLSGHTHHGCTRKLPNIGDIDGIEITMPSFSWRNKNNPNYGLGVFTPNNYSFIKCEMPKESTVINTYIFGFIGIFLWFFYQFRRCKANELF